VGATLSAMASETCRGIDAARADNNPPATVVNNPPATVVAAVAMLSGSIKTAFLPSSPSGIDGSGAL